MSPNKQREALGAREAPASEGSATEKQATETKRSVHDDHPIVAGRERSASQTTSAAKPIEHVTPFPPAAADSLAGCTTEVMPVDQQPPDVVFDHSVTALSSAGSVRSPNSPWAVVPPQTPVSQTVSAAKSSRWVAVVAGFSLLMSVATVSALGIGVYHYRTMLTPQQEVEQDDEDPSTQRAGLPARDGVDDDEDDETEPPSMDGVIKQTRSAVRGTVEVVDVGANSAGLGDVLLAQRIVADAKQQTLVLMINGRGCAPCDGFDSAIEDPKMQAALASVRLIRVDLEVFRDELRRMDYPTGVYPAFFLLSDDGRPYDAIHGGEWDDDVAKNIAPVLAPFVRGQLKERRHPEWAPTTTSIPL